MQCLVVVFAKLNYHCWKHLVLVFHGLFRLNFQLFTYTISIFLIIYRATDDEPLFCRHWSAKFRSTLSCSLWPVFQAFFRGDLQGKIILSFNKIFDCLFLEKEIVFEMEDGRKQPWSIGVEPRQLILNV
jgi:hypothetical protein